MKKRLIAVIVAVSLVICGLLAVLIVNLVKDRRPPSLEVLRPRVEALVESAREVNEILFGAGLPTYPRVYEPTLLHLALIADPQTGEFRPPVTEEEEADATYLYYYLLEDEEKGTLVAYRYCLILAVKDESGKTKYTYVDAESGAALTSAALSKYRYARRTTAPLGEETPLFEKTGENGESFYYYALPDYVEKEPEFLYTENDLPAYDYVRLDCGYLSVSDIKKRAEQVYGRSYLDSIYESLFTGVTVSGSGSGTLYARYYEHQKEDGTTLLMKRNTEAGFDTDRVFDYDTMRMLKTSNASYVSMEVETYLRKDPEKRVTVTLSLVLQDGQWMLDAPTY